MNESNRLKKHSTLLHPRFLLLVLLCSGSAIGFPTHLAAPTATAFRGTAAFADTKRATSFGERPSGSEAISQLRDWIVAELKPLGGQLSLDSFTAQTPMGPVPMANIILKFPGTSGKAIVVSGHYDTKRIPMVHFVGANDAGSSTGFLIEFARCVAHMKHPDDIYVVLFDGEEAVRRDWVDPDNCYGSRHLVAKWASEGMLSRIKALINIDMVGDKDLDLADDANSSQSLRSTVSQIAAKLGYSKYFSHSPGGGIEDDHKRFVDAGVNAIDIIDLDYGPNGSYWHTAEDSMDKVSPHSLQVVGDVVLELVKELEQQG
jgi:Zn-dependent M28 family amino/carboxypeptidase